MKNADILIRKADKLMTLNQYEKAQNILMDALKIDPKNPEIYYLLGDVLCKFRRFEDAIVSLQKADKLLPKHPKIYHLLGWAVFMNGDIQAGRIFMLLALEQEINDIQILCDLTVLEMRDNKFDKALEYVSRAKKIAPNDEMVNEVEMVVTMMKKQLEQLKNRSN